MDLYTDIHGPINHKLKKKYTKNGSDGQTDCELKKTGRTTIQRENDHEIDSV